VKEGFYCALMASLKAGRGAGEGENGRRRRVDSAGEELEVGGDTDRWGRPGSEWERERRGVGPRWFRGPEEERPAGFGWAA
jgi:hypothetical protein